MHNHWKLGTVALVAALFAAGCTAYRAQPQKYFTDWPAGQSPAEVGKRVSEEFAARKFTYQTSTNMNRRVVIYPEVCAWYGALTVAQLTGDRGLTDRLIQKFDALLDDGDGRYLPARAHVDDRVFGCVPLEIYLQTKQDRYRTLGLSFADQQWQRTTADGITTEARYWIDDMYMIPALQAQAFRATGDPKYLDRAATTMVAYLDRLQQPNGLFYHAPDSPFFWGRGNGWVAAGMTELLLELPAGHPKRARIMDGYKKMMASLLRYQTKEGLWRQLVDRPESWLETSGSGMFAFAMVTGVKNGWLDARAYGPAARKAWLGLVRHIQPDGKVREVCIGTGKAYRAVGSDPAKQLQYYLDRPRRAGDLHGQAPILWTATALLR
jgi:unsaturated rhamnogalacturonyl hydrolase